MLISLDYDDTFTADPIFWREVVKLGAKHGHKFICCSARYNDVGNRNELERNLPDIPIVLCGHKSKWHVSRERGFNVDVWIDDTPDSIIYG